MAYYGVGYFKEATYATDRKAFSVWQGMLKRCYDPKHIRSEAYKKVTVNERWHCFDNFLSDMSKISGWDKVKFYSGDLQLDKDVKGKLEYSTDSCLWLPKEENNKYQPTYVRHFRATDSSGNSREYYSQHECSRDLELDRNGIRRCLSGKQSSYKGWSFRYL